MSKKVIQQPGDRFGRWVVLYECEPTKQGNIQWLCRCSCGTERKVSGARLRNKTSSSCGCHSREQIFKSLWKGVGELGFNLWNSYKRGAHSRKLAFEITIEYAWELFLEQNRKCALSGQLLTMFSRDTEYWDYKGDCVNNIGRRINGTASLDRIDSSLGYIENNVQWIHKDINQMKMNLPESRFIELCKMIADYKG